MGEILGKTILINPGYGSDAQILVKIKNGKIRKIEFWKKLKQ